VKGLRCFFGERGVGRGGLGDFFLFPPPKNSFRFFLGGVFFFGGGGVGGGKRGSFGGFFLTWGFFLGGGLRGGVSLGEVWQVGGENLLCLSFWKGFGFGWSFLFGDSWNLDGVVVFRRRSQKRVFRGGGFFSEGGGGGDCWGSPFLARRLFSRVFFLRGVGLGFLFLCGLLAVFLSFFLGGNRERL